MPNVFVLAIVLSASLGAVITGYFNGSMNGILEMKGFQDLMEDLLTEDLMSMVLENTSSESPVNNSICSSGNGASSDIIIGAVVSVSSLGSVVGALFGGCESLL